jgi:hypothetical protein
VERRHHVHPEKVDACWVAGNTRAHVYVNRIPPLVVATLAGEGR